MTAKTHFTAAELAGFAVPGWPATKRGINLLIEREGWVYRERQGSGGGKEYSISNLPEAARNHIRAELRRREAEGAAPTPTASQRAAEAWGTKQPEARPVLHVDQGDTALRDARMEIMAAWVGWRDEAKATGQGAAEARVRFCAAYTAGQVVVGEAARKLVPSLSRPTLYRWEKALRSVGAGGLCGQRGLSLRGVTDIDRDPFLLEQALGYLMHRPHARATAIWRHLKDAVAERGEGQSPSERTVNRWLSNWKAKNHAFFTYINNPDEYRSKYKLALGNASEGITEPNQLWELDSSPADVMLEGGRHSLVAVVDVATRRAMVRVSKTSTAEAVCLLLRDAILEWGVPAAIKTDNGADYVSLKVRTLTTQLGFEQIPCAPFSPWMKPHVERFFGTLTREVAEALDAYVGHNVAERQAIRERQAFADQLGKRGGEAILPISAKALSDTLNGWLAKRYHQRPHEGLNGKSPMQAYAEARVTLRRVESPRALDMLMLDPIGRTIGKEGVTIGRITYWAHEMVGCVKERVEVRLDPERADQVVIVPAKGAPYVAHCPELTGIKRQELAAAGTAKAKEIEADYRQQAKEAKKAIRPMELAAGLAKAEPGRAQVAALPKPDLAHRTDGLALADQSAEVLAKGHNRPDGPTADDVERMRLAMEKVQAEKVTKARWGLQAEATARELEDPRERGERCAKAGWFGQTLGPEDQAFWDWYQTTQDWADNAERMEGLHKLFLSGMLTAPAL